MKELAAARARYGYRCITTLLRREGWKDGKERIYRYYLLDGLSVRSKPRKKRRALLRVPPDAATRPGERWAVDFVHDTLADGRSFRVFSVVDVFSRSSEVLEPGSGFTGARVAELLERAAKARLPEVITADNGTELTSKARDAWAFERGVKIDFTTPWKPTEDGFVESFQGRFHDERLNTEIFEDLDDAKKKIERWRNDYNRRTPHSVLGNLSPTEYLRSGSQRLFRRSEFRDLGCPKFPDQLNHPFATLAENAVRSHGGNYRTSTGIYGITPIHAPSQS